LPFGSLLNQRGFYFPRRVGRRLWLIFATAGRHRHGWFVAHKARQRQMATGRQFPVFWTAVARSSPAALATR
jgi:general L-amino acid transport system permease protein